MPGGTVDRAAELRERTKRFALRAIRLVRALPNSEEAKIIGRQVLRSGTSVGFWFELLVEAEIVAAHRLCSLRTEAGELLAIFGASLRTAKARQKR